LNKLKFSRLSCFQEEQDQDHFEFVELKEIYHESRCSSVTFSPETTLISPKVITLCTAGGANLHIINSNLENHNTVQVLKGHSGYINSVSFDYDGNYLASTGSDATLCIWDCRNNYAKETIFSLKSAGMSVKFHPTESGKLLVAEKNGLIHLYNVKSQQAILSLETAKTPLMYADWSVSNSAFVCAVAGGEITIWDMNKRPR
jgi:nuclear pore complex protein Nup37